MVKLRGKVTRGGALGTKPLVAQPIPPSPLYIVGRVGPGKGHKIKILSDIRPNGKQRPWRVHKQDARKIAASMVRLSKKPSSGITYRRAMRLAHCGDYLEFRENVDVCTGEIGKPKLSAAEFCRDRMCPMCAWRKSLVTFAQVKELMGHVHTRPETGGLVPIFLTLTVKNVPDEQLEDEIDHLIKSWSRLTRKTTNPWWHERVHGWYRSIEITRHEGDWHPHIHAILLVDQTDYFGTGVHDGRVFAEHDEWMDQWRWAARLDYDPSVDVRRVHGGEDHVIAEVAKYAVKPGTWLTDNQEVNDRRTGVLAAALKGRRLTAFGGVLREIRAELKQKDAEKDADLVHTGAEDAEDGPQVEDDVTDSGTYRETRYQWRRYGSYTNYVAVHTRTVRDGTIIKEVDYGTEEGQGS